LLIALVAVVAGLSVADFRFLGGFPPFYQHLGAEYYNIGRAMAEGRGFSNPFAEPTGPTAWMPPLFPTLLAGLTLILREKALVASATVAMTDLAHALVAFIIFRIAQRSSRSLSPFFAVAIYLVWLCIYYYWFFEFTHDIGLLGLVVAALMWRIFRYVAEGERAPWRWGLLGGLAALSSPSIFLAWFGFLIAGFVKQPRDRRPFLLAAGVALAIAAPWVARNALVFGRFIPIKSNLYYEAYAANVLDDDGIYDRASVAKHPFNSPTARFEYARSGETAFLEGCRREFFATVRRSPGLFLRKVVNRLEGATVFYTSMDKNPRLTLGEVIRRLVYPLPLIAFFFVLWRAGPHARFYRSLGLFAAIYLMPYVLVAFYPRYVMPLAGAAVLFVYAGADELTVWRQRRRSWSRAAA
jgi:hypothetical protein